MTRDVTTLGPGRMRGRVTVQLDPEHSAWLALMGDAGNWTAIPHGLPTLPAPADLPTNTGFGTSTVGARTWTRFAVTGAPDAANSYAVAGANAARVAADVSPGMLVRAGSRYYTLRAVTAGQRIAFWPRQIPPFSTTNEWVYGEPGVAAYIDPEVAAPSLQHKPDWTEPVTFDWVEAVGKSIV